MDEEHRRKMREAAQKAPEELARRLQVEPTHDDPDIDPLMRMSMFLDYLDNAGFKICRWSGKQDCYLPSQREYIEQKFRELLAMVIHRVEIPLRAEHYVPPEIEASIERCPDCGKLSAGNKPCGCVMVKSTVVEDCHYCGGMGRTVFPPGICPVCKGSGKNE